VRRHGRFGLGEGKVGASGGGLIDAVEIAERELVKEKDWECE
jgi:hypothetical protein